jgi:dolichyl-phosphate-mannose-protein mannosyltransferase
MTTTRERDLHLHWAVYAIGAAKCGLHLLTASRYGIFRDELYYLASAEHLDWGYVDQPPVIAYLTWFSTHVLGHSLLAIRLLPALAGAALVVMTGLLARELGGGRVAQILASLGVAVAPIYLLMHHWMTMNAFEPLLWMGCAWCMVRVINTGNPRYWLGYGVLAGIGMETKYSMAFFVAASAVGLLLSPQRKALLSGWFWAGAAIAFALFLPNLTWLVRHDFPFLELMGNIRRTGRDVVRGPVAFIADQAMILNPASLLMWASGVLWLLLPGTGRRYRALGWTYLALLTLFIVLKGKNYYVAPVYPMLFAAGAIALERSPGTGWTASRVAYAGFLLLTGALMALLVSPILGPAAEADFQHRLGSTLIRAENQRDGPLPQYFADEFGWEAMVREVAKVYEGLPADERAAAAIFANNYGEAAAIDFFGPKYGLPKAIGNHQNYWLWGPRGYTGDIVIVLGSDGRGDRELFRSVEVKGRVEDVFSRPDEHFDIYLCRGLKEELRSLWPRIKKWN